MLMKEKKERGSKYGAYAREQGKRKRLRSRVNQAARSPCEVVNLESSR